MSTNRTIRRMKRGGRRPVAVVTLTAAAGVLTFALSHAQTPPASSAQVAPGVIRPGPTADEPGLTQRPIGIDAEFVDKAGMIGKVERQASQLALDRSSNADVKAFARRMLDDHARIADELRRIGAQKGVPVQTRMLVDPAVTALRAKDGRAFDTAYVALAGPPAHEAAIRLYETEAKDGRDPQLRAFAARTLPVLNAHLNAARQLAKTVAAAQ
ncbi:DUF4142 domain-containing protein [Burkholderia cenocepacia]|uniref:DUF4142 domain-containing protein n=1 Tax=Burkholderia cepacia complex TaxID=87882 RepID=UPI001BA1D58C|nr:MULTISPECIES: DUF4142 domain-containing protein [Burkholderia cepacia complex]ELW9447727.1 DUF4142 domain-containing protein [Burkholderia cenocepacia]MBR8482415.1 DUF4142 domain-containing protein [Burkholderia cenocepacia]MDN7467459.1 DUF4142 domain-containing protein [Burkholderia orbicola]MDN7503049.1 DUF4142 domain-containing protein [Burkholderia orbicola]